MIRRLDRNSHRRPSWLLAAGPALAAEKYVGGNTDARTTLAFKAQDAVVRKFLPDGWEVDVATSGPAKDINLRLTFIDRLTAHDAESKHFSGSHSRNFGLAARTTDAFQMDEGGDLHEEILHIETHIEGLTDIMERCRKIILISKVAVAAGGILILAMVIGVVGFDPMAMVGAIAAVIGGTVGFGSNTSTLKQAMIDMEAAEAQRSELISRMDLKVVGEGEVKN